MRRLFRQFSFPAVAQSRFAGDARVNPRGRGARLLARPCFRCGVSTTPIWSWPASSGTGRRKPVRSPHPGTATSSWTGRGRRGAPDPSSQWIQDREPDGPWSDERWTLHHFFEGLGYEPIFVEGSDPARMHRRMAAAMDQAFDLIRHIQTESRENAMFGCPAGRSSSFGAPRAGPGRRRSMARRSRARGERTSSRCAGARGPGSPTHSRAMDKKLPARGTVRPRRATDSPTPGTRSEGDKRMVRTRMQTEGVVARPVPAGLAGFRGVGAAPGGRLGRSDQVRGRVPCRGNAPEC